MKKIDPEFVRSELVSYFGGTKPNSEERERLLYGVTGTGSLAEEWEHSLCH